MEYRSSISLKHLLIDNKKCVGLQFSTNKVIQALVDSMPNVLWSQHYGMFYVINNSQNLKLIYKIFRGVAWVNGNYFFHDRKINDHKPKVKVNVDWFRKRKLKPGYKACPEEYLQKLELKKYADNTVRLYVSYFEKFINHYASQDPMNLNEIDVRNYLQKLVQEGRSNSYVNLMVNSIKFYYEIVHQMPNRFYSIERPRKEERLPVVLSHEEVMGMVKHTDNIKHRCIVS